MDRRSKAMRRLYKSPEKLLHAQRYTKRTSRCGALLNFKDQEGVVSRNLEIQIKIRSHRISVKGFLLSLSCPTCPPALFQTARPAPLAKNFPSFLSSLSFYAFCPPPAFSLCHSLDLFDQLGVLQFRLLNTELQVSWNGFSVLCENFWSLSHENLNLKELEKKMGLVLNDSKVKTWDGSKSKGRRRKMRQWRKLDVGLSSVLGLACLQDPKLIAP
ncbi:hypothetical protein GBA52_025475 [Prunus armeniaca]|nr:hypothetical protein GBA52_025475 [Prunus armeniaca]